ncbi:hypothetical protein CKA81_00310 [Pollutimonas thiosulfatoxidans]|uniref:Uncharacterized protein n=1 Tax=Pollutimonas thiosulfatoxidans TaxID=2028345 RepID=A0A410G823_9BURK|nr:hypothetical protein CKA81_00310 [Pollutimonas thiosulfatoxidans]
MWPSRACSWLHQVRPSVSTASERGRWMPQCSQRTMDSMGLVPALFLTFLGSLLPSAMFLLWL